MATTYVQFTLIEAHTFKIILPTHVAEWYKTNLPDEEPDLTFNDDCWEVTWGEEDEVLEIPKGEEDVQYIECDKIEYLTVDDEWKIELFISECKYRREHPSEAPSRWWTL